VELRVWLQPRALRTDVVGDRNGALVVRVTAPPVDGKANAALCALLAERVGVPTSRVSVVRGATARDKVVRIEGVEAGVVRDALGHLPAP
jgi:uncharacterized protein